MKKITLTSTCVRRFFPIVSVTCVLLFAALQAGAIIQTNLQMQLGNPSGATADPNNHTHYLIQRSVEAIDYNDTLGEPNWASWDLTSADVGSSGRGNFITDTTLPSGFYSVTSSDYTGSGYDRGHNCPSADRTDTVADNDLVFYMSNIMPQAADNNQGPWEVLETYCRTLASAGNELLITCGPSLFDGSRIQPSGKAAIPGYTWKVIVVVPPGGGSALSRITSTTRVITVKMPNIAGIRSVSWTNYNTTPNQIQADTGFTFFTALDPSIAAVLRAKNDGGGSTPPAPTITGFSPASGAVGTNVVITGSSLTGASFVRFNGTAATSFTVNSSTQITATVPSGATSGTISVTTDGGIATSVASFTVTGGGGSGNVVISQVYGGGGNSGATYLNDFVELYNSGTAAVDLSAYAVQYASATGSTWSETTLSGSIAPGHYYLIQEAAGSSGISLPTPDATGSISMSATAGKVALTSSTTVLSGSNPVGGPTIVDFAGYGSTASAFEGTGPAPAPSATVSDLRAGNGATDTDNNAADFSTGTVNPRNSSTGGNPAPSITSFSPTSGPVGTNVVITGANFTGATAVKFNGTSASSFTVNSATQITATVPTGATSGTISVTTPGGTATSASSFTVTVPAPSITSFSPTSGPVGTNVVITGANFTGATAVKFNGTSASSFTVNSATQITATVPTGATSGTISVTTPGGTATSASSFTVTVPAPSITSFSPTSGPVGTNVVITGANFTGATAVKFNGTSASSFTVNSATQITATVPTGATSGTISVTTPGGMATSASSFTVTVPAPSITSFSPTSGPVGTNVVITGANFTGATAVKFNGTSASSFTVNSATQITATVPTGATSGTISVTTPGGTGTSSTSFTVSVGIVVISQVYGGGGNSGATYKNDFIELYNKGTASVDLSTYAVQYTSAAGSSWSETTLSGTILPGHYYLIQEAAGSGGTTSLPTPEAIGSISMSSTAGKVALTKTQTLLTVDNPVGGANVVDFVGYGTTADAFEGSGPAPAPSNTTADLRANGGATDTNDNASDFSAGAPNPRN